ncbi:MAG: DUF1513 domain-containing protein [Proteobacteria bacterium]|nr:DUF1513 domain-containing protein [Pseudomonadota bacterium]
MKTTRRSLIYGLGGALASATMLGKSAHAVEGDLVKTQASEPFKLKGLALTLGTLGVYHPDNFKDIAHAPARDRSLITVTDLETGAFRQQILDMPDGHHAMRLGSSNRIVCIAHHNKLCMVLSSDLEVIQVMTAPDGYVYGGHGYADEKKGIFILPARMHRAQKAEDHGILEIYDFTTLKKLDQLPSGGIHPHEIRLLPNGKEIVITHYGEISRSLQPKTYPYYFNIMQPQLIVYDAETLKPLRHYIQEDLNAILTHMDVDKNGNVFAVSNQYVPFSKGGAKGALSAIQKLQELTGAEYDYELDPAAREERRVAVPLPLLRINPQTGEVKKYLISNRDNRRSQSVAYQPQAEKVFATFTYSNTVVTVDKNDKSEAVDCFRYGITACRGVDAVPGTPYMLISDTYRGVALVDANTMELIRLYDVPVYRSPHVHFDLHMDTA